MDHSPQRAFRACANMVAVRAIVPATSMTSSSQDRFRLAKYSPFLHFVERLWGPAKHSQHLNTFMKRRTNEWFTHLTFQTSMKPQTKARHS